MATRFSKWVGVLFLLVGILGFFVEHLVILHFDLVHNLIHLAVGIAGIACSGKEAASRAFARTLGIVYVAVGLVGFVWPNVFGLMQLELAENLLHLVVGGLGLYVGFGLSAKASASGTRSA